MQEILPGVHHWTTFHEGIGQRVHSYYLTATEPAVLIDPRVPAQGLGVFRAAPPRHAYLTNRHHYRHSDRFAAAFGTEIWCHTAGLHEFSDGEQVTAFQHNDLLPGGVQALAVGVLCPEETALYIPLHAGILALGDAIIREHGRSPSCRTRLWETTRSPSSADWQRFSAITWSASSTTCCSPTARRG